MNNKAKLIKLDNYFYVVDDSKPKEGDYYIDDTGLLRQSVTSDKEYWDRRTDYYKVTHSTQELEGVELLNHSEIEELVYGFSVEKLNSYRELICKISDEETRRYLSNRRDGFNEGFKAHQELVKHKWFTIDDMIKFGELVAWNMVGKTITKSFARELSTKLIQSLLPKTEWDIEIVDGKIKLI